MTGRLILLFWWWHGLLPTSTRMNASHIYRVPTTLGKPQWWKLITLLVSHSGWSYFPVWVW